MEGEGRVWKGKEGKGKEGEREVVSAIYLSSTFNYDELQCFNCVRNGISK